MDDWTETKPLNLEEMDALVTKMRNARLEYDDAKATSSKLHAEYKNLEVEVIKALEEAGKKKYSVDDLGTFSIVDKLSVSTPKTIEDKKKCFKWIETNYGIEELFSMLGINHNTLNSFYKGAYEASDNKAMFSIDGLEAPSSIKQGRFRSA